MVRKKACVEAGGGARDEVQQSEWEWGRGEGA